MKTLLPAAAMLFAVASCDKGGDDTEPGGNGGNGGGGATKGPGVVVKYGDLDNEAAFNGDIFQIQSVVYTTEEIEGAWVFYLSPTADIVDIPGMEEAGDYIRAVAGSVKGNNAIADNDNALCYREVEITSENISDYKVSRFFVYLESPTLVEFSMEAEAAAANKMAMSANYYGYCTRWPSDSIDDLAGDRLCTEIAQAAYFGQGIGTNAHEYDLLVSTSPITQTTDGQLVLLEETGYAMHIAFFAIPNNVYRTRLPQGTYKFSENAESGTYLANSYIARFETENGKQTMTPINFDGDITVTTNNEGLTIIRGYFLDESNRRQMIAFRGKLGSFLDATSTTYLPALNEDVEFTANKINAIYYGRMGDEAIGTFELVIYEENYLENDDDTYAATVMLTAPTLFTSQKSLEEGMSKLNGTYYGASTFTQTWSWFRPVELNAYGMVQPFGTFVHKIDGSYYGAFGYAESGTVVVSDAGDGHIRIEFDLISNNGSKMKGSYDGPIEWDWQIVASDGDDGTSTLEADYDLNLDRITEARLVAPQQIYIGGVGYTNMSDYSSKWGSKAQGTKCDDIGYQYIAFGNLGINENPDGTINEGDIVYIELVTAPGEERQLKPGHYFVSRERWPAYFHPMKYDVEVEDKEGNKTKEDQGVAIKGMLLANTAYTSHWQHHKNQNGLSVMDGHAYFYGGELWITDNGNGTYTFDFDCTCVRDHHVRGKWTGPVTGIVEAEEQAGWHAPLKRPAGYMLHPATAGVAAEAANAGTNADNAPALKFGKLK